MSRTPEPNPIAALTRVKQALDRSLARYLADAVSWRAKPDDPAMRLITQIAADQDHYADALGHLLDERDAVITTGGYPMAFTSLHDLELDYLLRRLIEHQKQDIAAIESCVELAGSDLEARGLIEECLGAAKGHLESLEEAVHGPAPA